MTSETDLQLSCVPAVFPVSTAAESLCYFCCWARLQEGGWRPEKSCRGIWPQGPLQPGIWAGD